MPAPYVLVHISDLHVHCLPRRPSEYFSKRILGATNLVLRRRRLFPRARLEALVAQLSALPWQHLLITGDLTQLGTRAEFARARAALEPLLERGPDAVTVLPGNHDRYVPEPPGGGAFEAHFAEWAVPGAVRTRRLTERWWLAAWDSAVPADWHSAEGRVRPETLEATGAWLAELPADAQVIVANHYPAFYPPPRAPTPYHDLTNRAAVADWLLAHRVRLYLHGHIHHNWVHTVTGAHGALTNVNSASTTQVPRPSQRSAFHRIVLEGADFRVEPMQVE